MTRAHQIPVQPDNVVPLTPPREVAAEPLPIDPVDAVLGAWSSDQARADVEPIAVTARISRLAHVLQQCMERASSAYGLDWGQFLVLATLRGAGPPFRMLPRDLHRMLLLSPAAVTNRLCRLEAKGFIERTSDQADRRNMPVVLTALGLSTVERAMAACAQKGRDLFGGADLHNVDAALREMRNLLAGHEERVPRRRSHEAPRFDNGSWSVPPALGVEAHDVFVRTNMWPASDAEGVGVRQDGVDLPLFAAWTGHPHLVLGGEATGRADLLFGEHAFTGEPADFGVNLLAGVDLDAEMVDGPAVAGVFNQDQLERWLGDGEVGVALLELGRLGFEQLRVERDPFRQVVDVESELDTGHGGLLPV